MLKSWSIENFKPIVNSGELKLAPVTVLAGRNSSGKSSLLQSILMISQTLSNQVLDRALLPSGPIVQLGTFEDILNETIQSRILTVDFEIELAQEELARSSRLRQSSVLARSNVKSAQIIVKFRSISGSGSSVSAVEASKVAVESVLLKITPDIQNVHTRVRLEDAFGMEAESIDFEFNIRNVSPPDLRQFLKNVDTDYQRLVPYADVRFNYLGDFKIQDKKFLEEISAAYLVTLYHFLPTRLIRRFKIGERRKQRLGRAINYLFDYSESSTLLRQYADLIKPETSISENLKESIRKLCEEKGIMEDFSGQNLQELVHWFKNLKVEARGGRKKAIGNKIKGEIVQDLMPDSLKLDSENYKDSEGLEAVINNLYVEILDQAIVQITRFFTSKIRYLGPLRADPQASQKFAPSSELDDIGAKGEYAAAVYEANQNASIEWYNPQKKQVERGTLQNALDIWAKYLGVANQVRTEMGGISGVAWKVILKEGQKARSLPEVGVGVSQILPILVMGLLSPSNILLIIEQPELHLHPGVQARLGDFFVSLSKCKKQCLIETHSENLVSQLRYHMVQSGGQEESGCVIYFVDQDEKGAAKFEPVMISPQGNILNWPDGFFDETMLQEDRITAAGIKRRANKVKNG